MKALQIKFSELAMLLVVALMSLIANLGDNRLNQLVDRKALLATLAIFVVIAMFRYLQMALVIAILILAIGANLPHDLAVALEISQAALMAALGMLVTVSLLNKRFELLPSGINNTRSPIIEIAKARQELMIAISKGDLVTLHKLLAMNVGVNFIQDGTTPIHLAAEKGYSDVVQILLHHGANFRARNAEGKIPLEIALAKKFGRTSEILFNASRPSIAKEDEAEARNVDVDEWREQLHHKLRASLVKW